MRLCAAFSAGGAAILLLASSGCEQRQVAQPVEQVVQVIDHAVADEFFRLDYVEVYGPFIVTGVIGMSSPPGGPAPLNGVCLDQAWRALVARTVPRGRHVPSVFEVPDPNRLFKINPNDRAPRADLPEP